MRSSRRDVSSVAFLRNPVATRATKGASPVPFKAESVTNRTGQPNAGERMAARKEECLCIGCGTQFRRKRHAVIPAKALYCSQVCYKRARSHAEWNGFWANTKLCDNGCIEWLGSPKQPDGYGRLRIGKKRVGAHRYAYEITYGAPPPGQLVCHHCDNRICVRPDHLFVGTNEDNVRDMVRKGRQRKGSALPFAKLTEDDVVAIRTRYGRAGSVGPKKPNGVSMKAIAVEYGVTGSTVWELIVGRTWKSSTTTPEAA